jgi:2-isopropylmalate synthase
VINAGATTINIPDTVGYSNPTEFGQLIKYLVDNTPNADKAIFSVHCHNDLGLAVANTLAGLQAGARQAECTLNGIGERAGNASLEEIVMNLVTRKNYFGLDCGIDTTQIYRASRMVSSVTGIHVQRNKAIVGENAFAHEAGIHQDGVIKHRETYEIMTPESVGWKGTSMVMGKHSGRNALNQRMKELGFTLSKEQLQKVYDQFKVLADKKKAIYDADLIAIAEDEAHTYPEKFHLDYIQTSSGNTTVPTAMVKIRQGDEVLEGAGTGDGPVDAACQTIKSLVGIPVQLVYFTISSLTGGLDALGEVVITLEDEVTRHRATGRGHNTDVIVASALAYVDALNRLEFMKEKTVHPQEAPKSEAP